MSLGTLTKLIDLQIRMPLIDLPMRPINILVTLPAGILKFYIPPAIAIQKHKGGSCGFSAREIGSGMDSFVRNNT